MDFYRSCKDFEACFSGVTAERRDRRVLCPQLEQRRSSHPQESDAETPGQPFLAVVNIHVPLPIKGDNLARSDVRSRRHATGMCPGAFLPTIIGANGTAIEVEVSVVSTPLYTIHFSYCFKGGGGMRG